jgi:hypothetical protein
LYLPVLHQNLEHSTRFSGFERAVPCELGLVEKNVRQGICIALERPMAVS